MSLILGIGFLFMHLFVSEIKRYNVTNLFCVVFFILLWLLVLTKYLVTGFPETVGGSLVFASVALVASVSDYFYRKQHHTSSFASDDIIFIYAILFSTVSLFILIE